LTNALAHRIEPPLFTDKAGTRFAPFHAYPTQEIAMLYWAAVFFVIAIIAAVFGFGGIAAGAASIAKILFIVFVVLFVLSLIFGGIRRGPRL
jgi:uncharacterized membrane protein YtjA (UPF0391 family)